MLSPNRETGSREELRDGTREGTAGSSWEALKGESGELGSARPVRRGYWVPPRTQGRILWGASKPTVWRGVSMGCSGAEGLELGQCLGRRKGGQGAPEQSAEHRKRASAWHLAAVSSGGGTGGWARAAYSTGRQMLKGIGQRITLPFVIRQNPRTGITTRNGESETDRRLLRQCFRSLSLFQKRPAYSRATPYGLDHKLPNQNSALWTKTLLSIG